MKRANWIPEKNAWRITLIEGDPFAFLNVPPPADELAKLANDLQTMMKNVKAE